LQIEAIMVDSNSESGFFKDFQIPTSILVPESEVVNVDHVPKCPVIVFINSKSGGQLGGELLVTFCSLLNENQVPLVSCEEW
jgi:diacylglycerol kinase (ATP)